MTDHILVSWIGFTDLRASRGEEKGLGPVGQTVQARSFSHIVLLSDHKKDDEDRFISWLKSLSSAEAHLRHTTLASPMNFADIYTSSVSTLEDVKAKRADQEYVLSFQISAGTPAMAAVWIILSKTSHLAELIQSSPEKGVQTVDLPFEIAADYLSPLPREFEDKIVTLTQGLPPAAIEFDRIVYRCHAMKTVVAKARRLAAFDFPVLINGESGTGKELFARAIHASSKRSKGSFVAVNCGAIPSDLVESEFFGHTKGAFTGALHERIGHIESADGGTLFLDEIGDLPLAAQVKLLRCLQEKAIQKVGSTFAKPVDVRIIAATNRGIFDQVKEGFFREDLFHRIAVGLLHLPPLRERRGDVNLLIDAVLERINTECDQFHGWRCKHLSAGARNLLLQHSWPGNIRELFNTLARAAVWSTGDDISADDVKEAFLPDTTATLYKDPVMGRPVSEGLDLPDLIGEVARHYLSRALEETGGNKSQAAALLGLPSYQTLTNWMKRYRP